MSTEAVSAPAPAVAAPPAPAEDILVPPNPISDEPQPAPEKAPEPVKADKPAEKLSARDALKAAAEKVEKQDAADTNAKEKPVEAKPVDKARDETGKFAPKAGESEKVAAPVVAKPVELDKSVPHNEAPARFSPEAREKWATADETVRAETHRALKELEQGHAKYKQDATDFEPFREFHALAKEKNVDAAAALRQYVGIDQLLAKDFRAGIERICQNKGLKLEDFAAHVLKNPVTPQQQQATAREQALEAKIAALEAKFNGVSTVVTEQQSKTLEAEVEAFAVDKPHFAELSEQIASHIANDGLSLPEAYDKALKDAQALAQRLGFIPKTETAPIVPDVDLEAQTLRGQKSIAGAPSAGSAPASQKPSPNIKAALLRAMATAA